MRPKGLLPWGEGLDVGLHLLGCEVMDAKALEVIFEAGPDHDSVSTQ